MLHGKGYLFTFCQGYPPSQKKFSYPFISSSIQYKTSSTSVAVPKTTYTHLVAGSFETPPCFKFIVLLWFVTVCHVIFGFYMVRAMEIYSHDYKTRGNKPRENQQFEARQCPTSNYSSPSTIMYTWHKKFLGGF